MKVKVKLLDLWRAKRLASYWVAMDTALRAEVDYRNVLADIHHSKQEAEVTAEPVKKK